MEEKITQFIGITNSSSERANQYLEVSGHDVSQAVALFYEYQGVDLTGGPATQSQPSTPSAPAAPTVSHTTAPTGQTAAQAIDVDANAEDDGGGVSIDSPQGTTESDEAMARRLGTEIEDDEAVARRIQAQDYQEGAGGRGGAEDMDIDPETNVRRPVARTRDTLAAPMVGGGYGHDNEADMQAVEEQLAMRRGIGRSRPGIFNQRAPPRASTSRWDQDDDTRRQNVSYSTGGASDASSKARHLGELFQPPFELMSDTVSWDGLRAEGKENEKWILVDIQCAGIFDCDILNRDIWKNEEIKATVKENFVFKQYQNTDPRAQKYIQYYFKQAEDTDLYPHLGIVDPRTGEQVKVWSGPPVPKPVEFLSQLHEFLDRYSLKANARNPVARRKAEKKPVDVDRMTEEEMLEMAMQNSMDSGFKGPRTDDPDTLTKHEDAEMQNENGATNGDAGSSKSTKTASPFDAVSASSPHDEPAATAPNVTRIQFRHPGGRVIRRFAVDDQVRRIFEWLKASPVEGHEGQAFELVFMGKNLIAAIEMTIEEAGLKNGTVMVEFIEE